MSKKKKIMLPPECEIFVDEYGRALKLIHKDGNIKSGDICEPEELVKQTSAEFEKRLKGDEKDSPRVLVSRYADGTVDYAIRILEVNNLYDEAVALREVELKYLTKVNEGGYLDCSIVNDAAMIGNNMILRTAGGDTPYPFSYLGKLFDRLYKADRIYCNGSLGGFIKNLIILAAVAGLLCAIWLIEPVSALFSHNIFGILSVLTAGALGVFVWKKYQEYLGYFSGCLGYILAGALGMVTILILLDDEVSKAEACSAATVLAITAVAAVMMISYWIPSFFGNLRYMLHIATAKEKFFAAKGAVNDYLGEIRGALGKAKKLISSDSPGFANIYGYVTRHFSVVNENGEKAADEVVWDSFIKRFEAAEKYYDKAAGIAEHY